MKRLAALLLILLLACVPLFTLSQQSQAPQDMLAQWYSLGTALRENGLYPYVELRKGDKGYEVVALQTRLKELNYYQKEVVTNFGPGTEGAMRAFEKTNNLRVNGWASVDDQRLLFMSGALPAHGTTAQPAGLYTPPAGPTQKPQGPDPSATAPPAAVTVGPIQPVVTLDPGKFKLPNTAAPSTVGPIQPVITLNPGKLITQAPQISVAPIELQKPIIPDLPKPGF